MHDATSGGHTMLSDTGLTSLQVLETFIETAEDLDAQVLDTHWEESCATARVLLPQEGNVGPGDPLQGGVAMLVEPSGVRVKPFVFRHVCRNGAVFDSSWVDSCDESLDLLAPAIVLAGVRDAVLACAAKEVFQHNLQAFRHSCSVWRVSETMLERLLELMRSEGVEAPEDTEALRSRFTLANHVTATARDEPEPFRRWDLESLGGSLVLAPRPRPHAPPAAAVPGRPRRRRQVRVAAPALAR